MSASVVQVGGGTALPTETILEKLQARFADKIKRSGLSGKTAYALVPREHLSPIMAFLRDDPTLRFDFLVDVTAVDRLVLEADDHGERYEVVYQLRSLHHGHTLQVKTTTSEEEPRVPSLCGLWKSALWGERETHDMFGIVFDGNPDLRRLLMPENYPGFPLRKDYPLRGRGERDSFYQYRPGGAADPEQRLDQPHGQLHGPASA